MYRTHTCGELRLSDAGKEVTLCGWVATRRDHGKLIFIDLRDRCGLTQAVFLPKDAPEAHQKAQELRSEFVVRVKGIVNPRPANTVNPKLPTGEVELQAKEIEILNPSLTPAFEITEDSDAAEDTRLKYRYLDLRRKKVFAKLKLRSELYKIIRSSMDQAGFIECETPILTKSTPEGARDYLVPSRLNPGQFYALPQSPQLFKQILMVSGIERYYQLAKCFRDEDLRADRQPEFTQLDLEMSFVSEEDIFALLEGMMQRIFQALKGVEIKIPFPCLTYAQAQEKYKSDKPDLRKEFNADYAFAWVVDFPLFKFNQEERRWESEHHPFTAPCKEDEAELENKLAIAKARSYDLVLNGSELGSGSVRIHRQELQQRVFRIIGLSEDEARQRFGFLLEAFQYGAPPHAGFAFGIDRLLAILSAEASIREVITFPKTSAGVCPLTNAPSAVDEKQLKEVGLMLKKK